MLRRPEAESADVKDDDDKVAVYEPAVDSVSRNS